MAKKKTTPEPVTRPTNSVRLDRHELIINALCASMGMNPDDIATIESIPVSTTAPVVVDAEVHNHHEGHHT